MIFFLGICMLHKLFLSSNVFLGNPGACIFIPLAQWSNLPEMVSGLWLKSSYKKIVNVESWKSFGTSNCWIARLLPFEQRSLDAIYLNIWNWLTKEISTVYHKLWTSLSPFYNIELEMLYCLLLPFGKIVYKILPNRVAQTRNSLWNWINLWQKSLNNYHKAGMTTRLISISSKYGGHLENDEKLITTSSLMISSVFVAFSLIFIKNRLLSSTLICTDLG